MNIYIETNISQALEFLNQNNFNQIYFVVDSHSQGKRREFAQANFELIKKFYPETKQVWRERGH